MANTIPLFDRNGYVLFTGTYTLALAGTLLLSNIVIPHNHMLNKENILQYETNYSINKSLMTETHGSLHTEWSTGDKDMQSFNTIIEFANNIVQNSSIIDPDIAKVIDDNFMDLLA